MSDNKQTTVPAAQPQETLYSKDYKFILKKQKEDQPDLIDQSKLRLVLDGEVTETEAEQLFLKDTFRFYANDSELRGRSILQFVDLDKKEIGFDGKVFKVSFFDVASNGLFDLVHYDYYWWHGDDEEYSQNEINEFAKIFLSAKKANPVEVKKEQEEIKEVVLEQQAEQIREEEKEISDYEKLEDIREVLTEKLGYLEYKNGKCHLFIPVLTKKQTKKGYDIKDLHKLKPLEILELYKDSDQLEYLFRSVKEQDRDFVEMNVLEVVDETDNDVTVNFDDEDEKEFHYVFNGRNYRINEDYWVEPVEPKEQEEEEVPAPAPKQKVEDPKPQPKTEDPKPVKKEEPELVVAKQGGELKPKEKEGEKDSSNKEGDNKGETSAAPATAEAKKE